MFLLGEMGCGRQRREEGQMSVFGSGSGVEVGVGARRWLTFEVLDGHLG